MYLTCQASRVSYGLFGSFIFLLKQIEQNIGIPLKITHGSGAALYLSDDWFDEKNGYQWSPIFRRYPKNYGDKS